MNDKSNLTLKNLRLKSNHTQAEAAEYIQRSESTIQNWEREDNSQISSPADLHDLLDFYGADKQTVVKYIWERYGDPAIDPENVMFVDPKIPAKEVKARMLQIMIELLRVISKKKEELEAIVDAE